MHILNPALKLIVILLNPARWVAYWKKFDMFCKTFQRYIHVTQHLMTLHCLHRWEILKRQEKLQGKESINIRQTGIVKSQNHFKNYGAVTQERFHLYWFLCFKKQSVKRSKEHCPNPFYKDTREKMTSGDILVARSQNVQVLHKIFSICDSCNRI